MGGKQWSDWETHQADVHVKPAPQLLEEYFPQSWTTTPMSPPSAPGKRKLTASCSAKNRLAQDRDVNVGFGGWVFWVLQKRDGRVDKELDVPLFPAPLSPLDLSREGPVCGVGPVHVFSASCSSSRKRTGRSGCLNSVLTGSLDCGASAVSVRVVCS